MGALDPLEITTYSSASVVGTFPSKFKPVMETPVVEATAVAGLDGAGAGAVAGAAAAR